MQDVNLKYSGILTFNGGKKTARIFAIEQIVGLYSILIFIFFTIQLCMNFTVEESSV